MTTESEPQEWMRRTERSNPTALRLITWIALHLGRTVSGLFLYPICLYFLLLSSQARRASRVYLTRVFGYKPRFIHLFRHCLTFSEVMLDRVFLLNNQMDLFDVRIHGEDLVDEMIRLHRGCFLLGAHVGSFEIVRSLGRKNWDLNITVVMYEENARKFNSVLDGVNPELATKVIRLGKFDSMLKVEESLNKCECVGILADRSLGEKGCIRCLFLGHPASFFLGPLRTAAILKEPVFLMFGLYRGRRRYDVYFERLIDFSDVQRSERTAMIEKGGHRYAERLEFYCRMAPYNWFNFFDFWK